MATFHQYFRLVTFRGRVLMIPRIALSLRATVTSLLGALVKTCGTDGRAAVKTYPILLAVYLLVATRKSALGCRGSAEPAGLRKVYVTC